MFQELINKQVACPTKGKDNSKYFDSTSLSLLQFMYPSFKLVKSEFEIYPGEPFIYIGDIKWINKINKRPELHIIVSQTGEYDLSNMDTLINLAYQKHNKKRPSYIDELVKTWDSKNKHKTYSDDFIYNWKHLWVTGTVMDKEIYQNKIYINIIKEINSPYKMVPLFLKDSKKSDIQYLERSLLRFIEGGMESQDLSKISHKSNWIIAHQQIFYSSYSGNVRYAMDRLLRTINKEDLTLRTLSLLIDVTMGDKV